MCTGDMHSYPGSKGTCSTSSSTCGLALGRFTGFEDVMLNNVEGLMTALTQPPVSVPAPTASFSVGILALSSFLVRDEPRPHISCRRFWH